jgi:hypothetical protein
LLGSLLAATTSSFVVETGVLGLAIACLQELKDD